MYAGTRGPSGRIIGKQNNGLNITKNIGRYLDRSGNTAHQIPQYDIRVVQKYSHGKVMRDCEIQQKMLGISQKHF